MDLVPDSVGRDKSGTNGFAFRNGATPAADQEARDREARDRAANSHRAKDSATVEELAKWIIFMALIYWWEEFDEPLDGVVYGVALALGFATVENVLCVVRDGLGIGLLRALFAVPAHALFGAAMGFYMGRAKLGRGRHGSVVPRWQRNYRIALALVVFASWLPGRLVIGAYLFGAVTILQLHAQGAGVGIPSGAQSATSAPVRSITVSGTGSVTTVPDRAEVSFGVTTDARELGRPGANRGSPGGLYNGDCALERGAAGIGRQAQPGRPDCLRCLPAHGFQALAATREVPGANGEGACVRRSDP